MFSFISNFSASVATSVVASPLRSIFEAFWPAFGMEGEGTGDWPEWVLPVAVAFVGVAVLFLAFKWILRFAKRVK